MSVSNLPANVDFVVGEVTHDTVTWRQYVVTRLGPGFLKRITPAANVTQSFWINAGTQG